MLIWIQIQLVATSAIWFINVMECIRNIISTIASAASDLIPYAYLACVALFSNSLYFQRANHTSCRQSDFRTFDCLSSSWWWHSLLLAASFKIVSLSAVVWFFKFFMLNILLLLYWLFEGLLADAVASRSCWSNCFASDDITQRWCAGHDESLCALYQQEVCDCSLCIWTISL